MKKSGKKYNGKNIGENGEKWRRNGENGEKNIYKYNYIL